MRAKKRKTFKPAPSASFSAVASELSKWKGKLKGKNVICPCELAPTAKVRSLEIDFENGAFYLNSVKEKDSANPYFDLFPDLPKDVGERISEKQAAKIMEGQPSATVAQYLWAIGESAGVKSLTIAGFDSRRGFGVDFRDIYFKAYDVCIAVPPFDGLSDFLECLGGMDFALLVPFLDRTAPCEAVPLMERRAFLGRGRHLSVGVSDGGSKRLAAMDWLVSWPDAQDEVDAAAKKPKRGMADKFVEMRGMTMKDGSHPIFVGSSSSIPAGYRGWMFVSASALDSLSYSEFDWICTGCKGYFNKERPDLNPFAHKVSNEMIGYGTGDSKFHGLLIKRKRAL